ncbi:MlaC/ttg2D family ABC transporter substrate-binding protein [Thiolapillus sp.]
MKKTVITLITMMSMGLAQAQPGAPVRGYGYMPPMPMRAAPPPEPAAPEFAKDSPAALLEEGMGRLLARLRSKDLNARALSRYLNSEIAPYFDFDYMAKSAAGNMYRYMSADQRVRMAERIEQQFLSTMVQRLISYNNQNVNVVSQRMHPNGRTGLVSTAIKGPRGYPTRLDFRFYKARNGWKVFDVMANGQSAVVHYRRQFRQTMYMPRGRNQQPVARPSRQLSSGS